MGRPFTCEERDAEIWRLRTVEGLSNSQVAERVGLARTVVAMAWLRMQRRLDVAPGKPRDRCESPRDIILRLSLVEPPLTVERIAQMTGFGDGLVRVIRRRLRAAGHRVPLVLRDGNTNVLERKATTPGPRCGCGLAMPCDHTALAEMASSRMDAA